LILIVRPSPFNVIVIIRDIRS